MTAEHEAPPKTGWIPLPSEPLEDIDFLVCRDEEKRTPKLMHAPTLPDGQGKIWVTGGCHPLYSWAEMLTLYTHYCPVTRLGQC